MLKSSKVVAEAAELEILDLILELGVDLCIQNQYNGMYVPMMTQHDPMANGIVRRTALEQVFRKTYIDTGGRLGSYQRYVPWEPNLKRLAVVEKLARCAKLDIFQTTAPLHFLLATPRHLRQCTILDYVKMNPLTVNQKPRNHRVFGGLLPLHVACLEGDTDDVRILLEFGADVLEMAHYHKENGYSLLHVACFGGNINCIKLVLDSGADVNQEASDGSKPLRHLLDWIYYQRWHSYNPRLPERTCLHLWDIAALLVESGSDVRSRRNADYERWTWGDPVMELHIAILLNEEGFARKLIKHGASILDRDSQGLSALNRALIEFRYDRINTQRCAQAVRLALKLGSAYEDDIPGIGTTTHLVADQWTNVKHFEIYSEVAGVPLDCTAINEDGQLPVEYAWEMLRSRSGDGWFGLSFTEQKKMEFLERITREQLGEPPVEWSIILSKKGAHWCSDPGGDSSDSYSQEGFTDFRESPESETESSD